MSDYISREALLEKIKYMGDYNIGMDYVTVEDIMSIPSADVRENIHGTWEEWKGKVYTNVPICSNCKHGFPLITKEYNFCPNCGADMRKGEIND